MNYYISHGFVVKLNTLYWNGTRFDPEPVLFDSYGIGLFEYVSAIHYGIRIDMLNILDIELWPEMWKIDAKNGKLIKRL